MSQVLLCPRCGHELQEGGEKCGKKDCGCKCWEATFHPSMFETRQDRGPDYDEGPSRGGIR